METRESGYYWVMLTDKWDIAKYYPDLGKWKIFAGTFYWKDSDFKEINEKKIERE